MIYSSSIAWQTDGLLGWVSDLATAIASKIGEFVMWVFLLCRQVGESMMATAFNGLTQMFPSIPWDSVCAKLGYINHFFPLGECLSLGLLYGSLWSVVLTHKVIKSWIPTVSS